jgi:hypothetical protein
VLIAESAHIAREIYFAILLDRATGAPLIVASTEGGVEIESVAERSYEWIVHHAAPCREIKAGERTLEVAASAAALAPGKWFYDAGTADLHVRRNVRAGDDLILNISN